MEHAEFLRHVAGVIEGLNLRYYVTGSSASIYYGEHRFTSDVDAVVDLPLHRVDEFCRQFPSSDYYVSVDAARSAVLNHGMFNVIYPTEGLKLDATCRWSTKRVDTLPRPRRIPHSCASPKCKASATTTST